MRDFKQQLKAYGDKMRNTRYPYSEAELDKEIRSVVWNTKPNDSTFSISRVKRSLLVCRGEKTTVAKKPKIMPTKRRLWPTVAAVAIAFAIIIPTAIYTSKDDLTNDIASVKVGKEHIYFACNNGCSPEATLQNLKSIIL